jgi:hypothetical protein
MTFEKQKPLTTRSDYALPFAQKARTLSSFLPLGGLVSFSDQSRNRCGDG